MLLVVDRYRPRLRQQLQRQVDSGHIRLQEQFALLIEGEQLQLLARFSLQLLVWGTGIFLPLILICYHSLYSTWLGTLSVGGVIVWVLINIVSYVCILPIHEAIHALTILFWGGRPHFGISYWEQTRLPLALYCGAREQLFPRSYYLVIALAPLVVITLAAICCVLIAPGLASYGLLAIVGNISGAAGDLQMVGKIRRLPPSILIEDTETGYQAWQATSDTSIHV